MRNTILIIVLCLLFFGCSKYNFTTTPQIKFKSINTTVLSANELLQVTLTLTDKEGDVSQGLLYIQKVVPDCPGSGFIDSIPLPEFSTTAEQQGDIIVSYADGVNLTDGTYDYTPIGAPECNEDDTCYFRFAFTDNAMHTSDTIQSPTFIIKL